MNVKTSKGAAALLLAGIASAWPALASEIIRGELRRSQNAIDTFALDCPSTTSKAKARVWDITPPNKEGPRMRVKLKKCTVSACTSIKVDKRPNHHGEGGESSGRAIRAGGAGTYTVIIYKTASGRETYDVEATCHKNNGTLITGVPLNRCQNEAPSQGDRC